jgi:hypothetical protein
MAGRAVREWTNVGRPGVPVPPAAAGRRTGSVAPRRAARRPPAAAGTAVSQVTVGVEAVVAAHSASLAATLTVPGAGTA